MEVTSIVVLEPKEARVKAGKKVLINLDILIAYLERGGETEENIKEEEKDVKYGKLRKVEV